MKPLMDIESSPPIEKRELLEVEETGDAPGDGIEGEVVGAVTMMLKGENSSAVVKKVKDKIEQIKKTLP